MKRTRVPGIHGYFDDKYSTTIREFGLNYRFSSHFHPYVTELIRRLNEGEVSGLQAADTEYNTIARVSESSLVRAVGINGKEIILSKGELIMLPHNTLIVLKDDGTQAMLANQRIVNLSDGSSISSEANMQIILPENTFARCSDGTPIRFPRSIVVNLPDGKPRPILYEDIFSDKHYVPTSSPSDNLTSRTSVSVEKPYPVKNLDFTLNGAYAVYNWELFYHVPLTIAIHLSKNQRFVEAQQWFHYIFDPTDDSDGPTPERLWKVKPFQYTDVKQIDDILINLSTGADAKLQQETFDSIGAWKDEPFRPHVVARYRQSAYMLKTVMAYLDNLIAWGDSLFRQDTGESINEATQIYVLAANILGPPPQAVPKKGSVRPRTYANLRNDLTKFGNTLRKLETDIPFDIAPHPTGASATEQFGLLQSLGNALYFCTPRNDKLLGYWNTVADRLFKIRNSLNIQGIFRQLPLFEPPIDPALLAKATGTGLEVAAIINGANQPLPLVRFQFLVQKAAEICQEVKTLGSNLLSALEKADNEALAILRTRHEQIVLELAERVKFAQWQETIKAREGLEKTLANAIQRYIYYELLLGEKIEDIKKKTPELDSIDLGKLDNIDTNFVTTENDIGEARHIEPDIVKDGARVNAVSGFDIENKIRKIEPKIPIKIQLIPGIDLLSNFNGKKLNRQEAEEMNQLMIADFWTQLAAMQEIGASVARLIPDSSYSQSTPWGGSFSMTGIGGSTLSSIASSIALFHRFQANMANYQANKAAKIGQYSRREQEWAFQSNLARGEISQIFKQLRAAQIREYITNSEWKNHQKQIVQAQEIEYFLTGEKNAGWKYTKKMDTSIDPKKTNQALYVWMKREVKGLYGQCFEFAFDIAKKAERALQHELGNPELSFIQYGYLAGNEGLLAGEKLCLDIKRMEMAYHDLNQREYELTKHVSLLQINPLALLRLRATGSCSFYLPEELFDLDCPGHYFRRIKSIGLSIPCVVGPYTSINCKLTLLKSRIRKSAVTGENGYAYTGIDDSRFSDYFGSMQSIVTSTGQNDSGLFELNLRDERYLPFEGSGVISEWELKLPANPSNQDPCQFDYDTISDLILHIRYTAREGGDLLRNTAMENLKRVIEQAQAAGSVRLFSVRHEFPTEWAKCKSTLASGAQIAELKLQFKPEHYPFWGRYSLQKVLRIDACAKASNNVHIFGDDNGKPDDQKEDILDAELGNLRFGQVKKTKLETPTSEFRIFLTEGSIEDLWLAITWSK